MCNIRRSISCILFFILFQFTVSQIFPNERDFLPKIPRDESISDAHAKGNNGFLSRFEIHPRVVPPLSFQRPFYNLPVDRRHGIIRKLYLSRLGGDSQLPADDKNFHARLKESTAENFLTREISKIIKLSVLSNKAANEKDTINPKEIKTGPESIENRSYSKNKLLAQTREALGKELFSSPMPQYHLDINDVNSNKIYETVPIVANNEKQGNIPTAISNLPRFDKSHLMSNSPINSTIKKPTNQFFHVFVSNKIPDSKMTSYYVNAPLVDVKSRENFLGPSKRLAPQPSEFNLQTSASKLSGIDTDTDDSNPPPRESRIDRGIPLLYHEWNNHNKFLKGTNTGSLGFNMIENFGKVTNGPPLTMAPMTTSTTLSGITGDNLLKKNKTQGEYESKRYHSDLNSIHQAGDSESMTTKTQQQSLNDISKFSPKNATLSLSIDEIANMILNIQQLTNKLKKLNGQYNKQKSGLHDNNRSAYGNPFWHGVDASANEMRNTKQTTTGVPLEEGSKNVNLIMNDFLEKEFGSIMSSILSK